MTANKSPTVGDVFELLNRWRHLPFYSLETRAAPFFALFLRDILRAKFGTKMHETVIPEFPLRIGKSNLSNNVDYVAFSKDMCTVFLVELKTDMGSKRPEQDEYLCKAQRKEFSCLVRGVRELAKASNSKQKYVHLLHELSKTGFVSISCDTRLYEKSFDRDRVVSGWTEAINGLEIKERKCSKTKVVYIQPKRGESDVCGFRYICFKEVADIVQRHGDLGCMFANFLRQWIEDAGSPDPRKIHRT